MKVAIIHDWFVGGGAERVVLELHRMYPKAPIYTAYCNDEWRQKLSSTQIITSYMQKWPFSKLRKFLPILRGLWFSRLDLSDYDLVISSSGAEAKFVKAGRKNGQMVNKKIIGKWKMTNGKSDVKQPLHISYIHAPTHYYWSRYEEYLAQPGFGFFDPLASLGLKLLVGPMRRWDYKAAQRPDHLIANSNFTKEQIKKHYNRDSYVIHPPVDVDRFKGYGKPAEQRHGFVTAGRQAPYKKIDLAVEAATSLKVPLAVIGRGPEHRWLKKLAGRNVTFLTKVSDEDIARHFGEAKAFIFPGVDDFGIVAVEAMAAGTPVIAYRAGGALDYINKDTGLFFNVQTPESLAKVMDGFSQKTFDHSKITAQAAKFSPRVFQKEIANFIRSAVKSR
ncbi:MAG TPA: glycosyltransferase [Candidatus Saccharimonadales bacterium]|nr:glycosyltransferase [Candidatus Saccharimonadales bacterium]